MRLGTALVLSAPSGAGKTTLVKKLIQEFPNFGFSISFTTRAPREGEVDGRDYRFTTMEDFLQRRDRGEFAEWAMVHGNCYGTPLAPLREMLQQGRDVLFDIDVQGAAQLRLALPKARLVFILPPSMQELERRLRSRGTDAEDVIQVRLANAKAEMREARWFDDIVLNDSLDRAYADLRAAYLAATLAPSLHTSLIDSLIG
ncbi:MAG: guanylate kinase [Desulfovibrio sp.]|nr:guanylate kinase [Desulfovibrio sp.]